MSGPEIVLAGVASAELIERAPAAIVVTNADGTIVTWNHEAERLFGWEAREAVGRSAAELGGGRAEPAVIGEVRSRVSGGGVWDGEVPAIRKD